MSSDFSVNEVQDSDDKQEEKKEAQTPIPRNRDEFESLETGGAKYHPSVAININREHQMVVAAINYSNAASGAGIDETHFEYLDYRSLWRAVAILHRKGIEARLLGHDVPEEISESDLVAEAIKADSERWATPYGRRFITKICGEKPVSLFRAVQLIPAELKSRSDLGQLASRLKNWSKEIPETSSPIQLQHALAVHAREFSRSVTQGTRVDDPCDLSLNWETLQRNNRVISTGFPEIDIPTGGGLGRGELMVVGGGTGHGKSFFATALMRRQKQRDGAAKTLYISVEDPAELLVCRLMAQFANPPISPKDIRSRLNGKSSDISNETMDAAARAMRMELHGKIEIVSAPKWSLAQICSLIRTRRHVAGIDLVIVDYLQAITPDDFGKSRQSNRTAEVSIAVSQLKQVANEVGVGLVVLSQYSREEYKDGQEPTVNSCKHAGEIENESEVMVLLWRDSSGTLFLKLAKLKWASAMGHRYTVQTHSVTGELLDWIRYEPQHEDDDDAGGGRGGGRAKKRRNYGGRA